MNRQTLDNTIELATEKLQALGIRCIEVEWDAKQEKLVVYIDSPDGADMQACVSATKVLGECELLPNKKNGEYELEISSPGVERPLRLIEDFSSFVGKKIQVSFSKSRAGLGKISGIIEEVDLRAPSVTLKVGDETIKFAMHELNRARIVYDWNAHSLHDL